MDSEKAPERGFKETGSLRGGSARGLTSSIMAPDELVQAARVREMLRPLRSNKSYHIFTRCSIYNICK